MFSLPTTICTEQKALQRFYDHTAEVLFLRQAQRGRFRNCAGPNDSLTDSKRLFIVGINDLPAFQKVLRFVDSWKINNHVFWSKA